MKQPKPVATKATLFLNGTLQTDNFTSRSEAIAWVMTQANLKRFCGHAMCLNNYNYVAFPKSAGWARIISL